jgi:hypothetical protein
VEEQDRKAALLTHQSTAEHGFVGTLRRMAASEGGPTKDIRAALSRAGV